MALTEEIRAGRLDTADAPVVTATVQSVLAAPTAEASGFRAQPLDETVSGGEGGQQQAR
jgi:hypothetical protein